VESKVREWIIEAVETTPEPQQVPRTRGRKYAERKPAGQRRTQPQRTLPSKPRRHRNRGAFAMGSDYPRWITAAQFANDVKAFASKVPNDITAIAGVARSGLSAATMLSMYLHLPLLAIRQTLNDVIEAGNGWRLGGSSHIKPQGKVLVVDDTCMSGNSFRQVLPIMRGWNATTAAIYCNPAAALKPDMWHTELKWPHMLEWNIFNSVLSPNMALDFDGVLCHDPSREQDDDGPRYLDFIRNARPLYLPRKAPVPLIVTARVERYRAETENWLRRHGVQWHRLVMHPAATTRERERHSMADYKAQHFGAWAKIHRPRPAPLMFVESDPRQARQIHERTGQMTVCPHTAEVHFRPAK
jgi:hypoxanthine phosphoribosyltransferase